jgi:hypothetical protein
LRDQDDFFSLGQSGFIITVVEASGHLVVRKEAPQGDSSLAARLLRQFEKHLEIENEGLMSPISVPKIRSEFANSGYTMEYAPGRPLGYVLQLMSQSEVNRVGETICEYFMRNLSKHGTDEINQLAMDKLSQLKEVYLQSRDPVSRVLGLEAIDNLVRFFDSTSIPSSPNHGDFSFENLVSNRRGDVVYALDFLDSPFESTLIDVGRIWLDLKMGWWAKRSAPNASAFVNMAMLKDKISVQLGENGVESNYIEGFATLATLRVLPYTNQPHRLALLKNSLRLSKGLF